MEIHYILESSPGEGLLCRVRHASKKGEFLPFPLKKVTHGGTMAQVGLEDRPLLMGLYMLQAMQSDCIHLPRGQSSKLIQGLVRTGRCHWQAVQNPPISWGTAAPLELAWTGALDSGYQPVVRPADPGMRLIPLVPPLYLDVDQGLLGPLASEWPDTLQKAWASPRALTASEVDHFVQGVQKSFPGTPLPSPEGSFGELVRDSLPQPRLDFRLFTGKQLVDGLPPRLEGHLGWLYEGDWISSDAEPLLLNATRKGRRIRVERNTAREKALSCQLESVGFRRSQQDPSVWRDTSKATPGRDLAGRIREISTALSGWTLTWRGQERLRDLNEVPWYWKIHSHASQHELDVGLQCGAFRISILSQLSEHLAPFLGQPLADIQRDLRRHPLMLHLADEEVGWLPEDRLWELLERVHELLTPRALTRSGRLRLHAWRLAEISREVPELPLPESARQLAAALKESLAEGHHLRVASPPAGFPVTLRLYQLQGLGWLDFLQRHGMQGILADDMGLGKTVQTLAHIQLEKEAGRLDGPVLIVAPASVTHNWMGEARRLTPRLSRLEWGGKERSVLSRRASQHDLVVITYNLLRLDQERLAKVPWSLVVLDEAQFIKNPSSHVAQAARRLPAPRRLCLTGTPMENHLGELWSLFQFLLPGYLGSEAEFKEQFRRPIEQLGLVDRQKFLIRRISPLILRRTKDEVAKDLPEKTEIPRLLELSSRQAEIYEVIRRAMKTRVTEELRAMGMERSRMIVLEALLKLRQVCCDPRLVTEEAGPRDSSKLRALMEWLPDMVEEGRHILIFSQFTSMLDLIGKALEDQGLRWGLLTGETRNRSRVIEDFQAGRFPIFLISLKAGGFGLNLTRADTVIHYDPWWNPAVENQATDRAHRIGQEKPVFVYKLITRGSVEERMVQLQERKRNLADGILEGTLQERVALTEEDVHWLLSSLASGPDDGLPSLP